MKLPRFQSWKSKRILLRDSMIDLGSSDWTQQSHLVTRGTSVQERLSCEVIWQSMVMWASTLSTRQYPFGFLTIFFLKSIILFMTLSMTCSVLLLPQTVSKVSLSVLLLLPMLLISSVISFSILSSSSPFCLASVCSGSLSKKIILSSCLSISYSWMNRYGVGPGGSSPWYSRYPLDSVRCSSSMENFQVILLFQRK